MLLWAASGFQSCLREPPTKPDPITPTVPTSINPQALFPDIITADLRYPDSLVGAYSLTGFDSAGWTVDAESWPGHLAWDGHARDKINLFWRVDPSNERLRLGEWLGTLQCKHPDSSYSVDVPYRVKRVFGNFFPAGDTLGKYWKVPDDKRLFTGGSEKFALVFDAKEKPDTAFGTVGGSVMGVRSRFALMGDYVFDIRLDLPITVESGYSVALFLSEAEDPVFLNLTTATGFQEGFTIFSSGAGIRFNAERGQNLVEAIGFGDRSSKPGIRLPNNVTFRFTRKEGLTTFEYSKSNDAEFHPIQSWFYPDNAGQEQKLYLHMLVGVFDPPARTLNVEWGNFVIHEGEVVFTP